MKCFLVLLAFLPSLVAFSPLSVAHARSKSRLHAIAVVGMEDELSYRYLLAKAKECAFSETSSAAEARLYLTRILELESGCVSGTIAGGDLCDNVSELAEVVSHLRQKVDEASSESALNQGTVAVSLLLPASMFFTLALLVLGSTMDWGEPNVLPFTIDEWVWAAKGGYLHTMIDHYIRNGGL